MRKITLTRSQRQIYDLLNMFYKGYTLLPFMIASEELPTDEEITEMYFDYIGRAEYDSSVKVQKSQNIPYAQMVAETADKAVHSVIRNKRQPIKPCIP